VRKEKLAVLGQVAGSVGTSWRNPLGVMSNAVYFLQTVSPDADETTREYLNILKNEIANPSASCPTCWTRCAPGRRKREIVGVPELLMQTLRKCNVPASVSVQMDLPSTLPPLQVDAMQMQQVFRNLISNGIEAMPDGGTLDIRAVTDESEKDCEQSMCATAALA